jgi:Flp pilus assembly protein TadG
MKRRQGGVALVEFALILPFLLLLSITAVELGRAIWQYDALTKSVRDAARYLSLQTPGDATRMTRARNLVVYGNISRRRRCLTRRGRPRAPRR